MTDSASSFCDTCPILALDSALVRAIEQVGPTVPNSEIADAVRQIDGLKHQDNCHICIPVVLKEGPLVPMIERLETPSSDWQHFDTEARQVHSFIERKSMKNE